MDGSLQSFEIFLLLVLTGGASAYAGWHFSRRRAVRFFSRIINDLEGALHLKELEGIALRASVADKEAIAGQLEDAYKSLGDLTASFFDAERKLEGRREELDLSEKRIEALEEAQRLNLEELEAERQKSHSLEQRCERIGVLEAEVAAAAAETATRVGELKNAESVIASLRKSLELQENESLRLMAELEAAAILREEIAARSAEIDRLRKRVIELEPLQFINEELRREIESPPVARRYFSDDGVMHQIRDALVENVPTSPTGVGIDVAPGKADVTTTSSGRDILPGENQATTIENSDLKQIPGIGPAIEKLLKENGVDTINQIANWEESDILHFEKLLKSNRGRIRRDDWVGGAKARMGSSITNQ